MKHVVIFTSPHMYEGIADNLLLNIRDYVNFETKHNKSVIEIDEKDMYIEIRYGDENKIAGIRPDYVLFYGCSTRFKTILEYNMAGRYTEILGLGDLVKMIID